MMLTTSINLLERVRQRDDDAAWERFVALYSPLLLHWARRTGLSSHDAADLVQELFLLLMRELPDFQYDAGRGTFRGWLKTITIRKCGERRRRWNPVVADGGSRDAIAEVVDDAASAFWEHDYRQFLLRRACALMQHEFEPRTWQACWEQIVSDRTAAEVGRELGMSEAAVYVAKSRVLRRLREELHGLLE